MTELLFFMSTKASNQPGGSPCRFLLYQKRNISVRSIEIIYHESDVKNDNIDGYWYKTLGDRTSGYGLVNVPRVIVDHGVLRDYLLLRNYEPGRYFELVKSTSYFVISEIVLTFAELRKYFGFIISPESRHSINTVWGVRL